jgi:hypothetical protein
MSTDPSRTDIQWADYEDRPPTVSAVQVLTDNIHDLAQYFAERNVTATITYSDNPYRPRLVLEGHPQGLLEAQAGGEDDGDWLVNDRAEGLSVVTAKEFRETKRPSRLGDITLNIQGMSRGPQD